MLHLEMIMMGEASVGSVVSLVGLTVGGKDLFFVICVVIVIVYSNLPR